MYRGLLNHSENPYKLGLMGSVVPGSLSGSTDAEISEVDGRSAREWVFRAAEYCEWRAGRDSRRVSHWRWNQDRLDYLSAAALLVDTLMIPERVGIAPALPVLNPAPNHDPRISKLCQCPRSVLVGLLMEADPALSNRKLISGLHREKLASMICAARDAAAPLASPGRVA